MPDEVKKRLQDSTEACIKSYEAWHSDKKNNAARESLHDAVHELRKVASRLEIELATSASSQGNQKPIPTPSHRNAKGPQQAPEDNESQGNKSKSNKPKPGFKKPANKDGAGDAAAKAAGSEG